MSTAPKSVKSFDHQEVKNTPFSVEHAIRHVRLAADKADIPQILGWSGPARSGTTGLLFLLAGHASVDKVYFQPLKTLLRKGAPEFDLTNSGSLICMKEVFRGCCPENGHDPIAMLLKAGVPAHKITWISILREPLQNYASWTKSFQDVTPEAYIAAQKYSVDLFHHYRAMGVRIVPFTYELLVKGEAQAINTLLRHIDMPPFPDDNLSFNGGAIGDKMQYGQAADTQYFDTLLKRTIERERFVYTRNDVALSSEVADIITQACSGRYSEFHELAKRELVS